MLDLNIGIGNNNDDYYCDQQHCKIVGHQPKTNVPPPPNDTVVNNDGSITSTNEEDSLYEVQSVDDSNDDSIFEHHTTEKIPQQSKRQFHKPNHNLYPINSFITSVEIEMILSIDHMNIVSFDSFKQRRNKRKPAFKGDRTREDMRSNAIRFANNHIINGDLSILSSTKDNPILDDSVGYNIYNNIVSTFDKRWGRRINRICTSTSSIYGETYIEPYKEKLKEMFQVDAQNSSKKMNAAMMRNELRKLYPNIFSIPGETEIKKYISQLFAKSKTNYDDNEVDLEMDEVVEDESDNIPRVNWEKCLKKLVEEKPTERPQVIYDNFILQFDDNEQLQLPRKEDVK